MIRARLVGLGSFVLLVAIVVGVPVLLWTVAGSPVPSELPSLDEVRTVLTSPDDGSVLLGAVRILAWIAWAVLSLSVVLEAAARLRGTRTPRLPGLRWPQVAARQLVAAAALLFIVGVPAVVSVAGPAQAAPPPVTATATVEASVTMAPVPMQVAAPDRVDASVVYTVVDGDSLWKIAESQLGDAHRWQEVYQLNVGVIQADGYALDDAGWVEPGWQLVMPTDAQAPSAGVEHVYTVQPGDTLSQIAADELGDAGRYPEIFEASTSVVQPDGQHLADPDLIHPGWQMTIPGTVEAGAPEVSLTEVPQLAPGNPADSLSAPEAASAQSGAPELEAAQLDDAAASVAADATGPETQKTDRSALEESAVEAGQNTVPERAGSGGSQSDGAREQSGVRGSGVGEWAPWVLGGLAGAGGVLAGSLWLALRARRRAQWRHRLPGRMLAVPGPLLAPVEKTVVAVGPGTAETVEFLDGVLRRLGAVVAVGGGAMPDLVAVELTGEHVVLHLGGPWELGVPWEGFDGGHRWRVPVGVDLDLVGPAGDHPAPYPLLVTVGTSDEGGVWLFNLEDLAVTLTGDLERARDFGRYLVAEIACSPWAAWTRVECVGLGAELVGLNPDRIRYHHPGDGGDPVGDALAGAMTTVGRATAAGADVVTARSVGAGMESWSPLVLMVDATSDDPALDPLLDIVSNHAGQTGTSVVVAGSRPGSGGVQIVIGDDGRVRLPEVGLDLAAVGLDITEAAGCAGLVAHADLAVDPVSVPYDDTADTGWQAWSDAAGALRPQYTVPRTDTWYDPQAASSVLPSADEVYLDAAATTPDDLAALAPRVPVEVRDQVQAADPGLDSDLAAWYSGTPRPRVRLLGPVQVAATGTPPTRRGAFFTELVAYLALHPQGVTPAQVAEALGIGRNKAREYLRTVRAWLGVDPHTGQPYLPETDDDRARQLHALVDLDLFRRLRVRGQARGADGTDDLLAALYLVAGRPFDDPAAWRPGGWAWLVEDRTDETAMVAVIDTAHTVVTHALATGDLVMARQAAETAQRADPYDEIIRLDLAAVASAEGRYAEAARIVTDDIGNRTDDGHAPPDLSHRTQEIITAHPDWHTTRAS